MITVENTINASINKVWEFWTLPEHIQKWNTPSEDWHTSQAENDVKVGGKFKFRMGAKDKSESFDFEGEYTEVKQNLLLEYILTDNRTASVHFEDMGDKVKLTEVFEPQTEHPVSMQKEWCSAVIANFKEYVENFKK